MTNRTRAGRVISERGHGIVLSLQCNKWTEMLELPWSANTRKADESSRTAEISDGQTLHPKTL